MDQTIINWIMAGFGTLFGFLLNVGWQSLKDLHTAHKELTEKVGSMEVLVAGNYVKKEDFDRSLAAIFAKLDRIEDKIGGKVDK